MNNQRRLITICAALGIIVAAFLASLVYLGDPDAAPELYGTLLIICPPALLIFVFGKLIGNAVGASIFWIFIGVLNAGLYAAIGAAIAGWMWKPEE